MATQKLIEYLKEQQAAGHSTDAIKAALKESGYDDAAIEDAFALLGSEPDIIIPIAEVESIPELAATEAAEAQSVSEPALASEVTAPAAPFTLPKWKTLRNEANELYVACIGKLLKIMLLPLLVFLLGMILLAIGIPVLLPQYFILGLLVSIAGGLILLCAVGLYFASSLAMISVINKSEVSIKGAYRYAFKNLLQFAWLILLQVLIVYGGILAGIVPGIIFGVWFSFITFIFVIEGDCGMSALQKSREYLRGNTWKTLWLLLIPCLLLALPIAVLSAIGNDMGGIWGDIISCITTAANVGYVSPFILLYTFSLYKKFSAGKPELCGQRVKPKKAWMIVFSILGVVCISLFICILAAAGTMTNTKATRAELETYVMSEEFDALVHDPEFLAQYQKGIENKIADEPIAGDEKQKLREMFDTPEEIKTFYIDNMDDADVRLSLDYLKQADEMEK
jgi:hypothetical protein